jgi:hypothetical protein
MDTSAGPSGIMTKLLKEMQQRKHSSSQPENFPLDLILVDTSGVQQGFIVYY